MTGRGRASAGSARGGREPLPGVGTEGPAHLVMWASQAVGGSGRQGRVPRSTEPPDVAGAEDAVQTAKKPGYLDQSSGAAARPYEWRHNGRPADVPARTAPGSRSSGPPRGSRIATVRNMAAQIFISRT